MTSGPVIGFVDGFGVSSEKGGELLGKVGTRFLVSERTNRVPLRVKILPGFSVTQVEVLVIFLHQQLEIHPATNFA